MRKIVYKKTADTIDEPVGEVLDTDIDEQSVEATDAAGDPCTSGEDDDVASDEEDDDAAAAGRRKKDKSAFYKVMDILVPVVCGSVIIFSGYNLYKIYTSYAEAEAIYDGVALFVSDEALPDSDDAQAMEEAGFPYLDVDYDSLLELNPDFLGWLYFPLLDISYPVVHGDEESKYLETAFDGTPTKSGCIYIDAWSDPNLRDMTTIIYGHNMRNGSMFGSLKKIRNESGLILEDPYFYYYTPTKAYKCHVFCYYLENAKGKTYSYPVNNPTYDEYMDYILEKNEYKEGPDTVDIAHRPRIVTLSTCSGRNSGKRTVIHGAVEDTYEYKDVVIGETISVTQDADGQ